MTRKALPFLDKSKQAKKRIERLLVFGLTVAAVVLFGGIFYHLHKTRMLGTILQPLFPEAQVDSPITAAPLSSSRCAVQYTDLDPYFFHGKLIYCDANFQCRVKTDIDSSQVSFADKFSDGLARIALKSEGKPDSIVYLGTSGKIEVGADPGRALSGPYSEGLAFAVDKQTGQLGFIDKHGKYAITPQFYLAGPKNGNSLRLENQLDNSVFSSGLAPVYTEKVNSRIPLTQSCGYIDHKGRFVIPAEYLQCAAFVEGRARICARDNSKWKHRWGYIDPHGVRVIAPVYMQVQNFSETRGAVLDYQGRWGFVDKQGKYLIPSKFSDADSFSQGLAAVAVAKEKKLWGYIRNDGSWLVEPKFDRADAFRHGEAYACCGDPASKSKEEFWINTAGKIERRKKQLIPFDIKDLPFAPAKAN